MLENEKILNDEFVDTNSAVADSINDYDDFYDDEEIVSNTPTFASLNADEDEEVSSIPVNNFNFNPSDTSDVATKLDFNNIENGIPVETDANKEEDNYYSEESVFNDIKEENTEDLLTNENSDISIDNNESIVEDNLESSEDVIEEDSNEEPVLSSLSSDEMDKMIEEDKEESLDDSYVLSNFDVLFDSLYNDVNGANNFISDLIEQKKNANLNDASLKEEENKLLKEKEEFAKYMKVQKDSIEEDKRQCQEFIKTQKARLQSEEDQFNRDMKAAEAERKLKDEKTKIEEQKLATEKEQFEDYKKVEEQKLESEKQKLATEKEQFEKEKSIELEKIENERKELQTKKEQFARTKELEEKKLELESKNLSQSCAKFKELVSQFNSGFQQLPEDK